MPAVINEFFEVSKNNGLGLNFEEAYHIMRRFTAFIVRECAKNIGVEVSFIPRERA